MFVTNSSFYNQMCLSFSGNIYVLHSDGQYYNYNQSTSGAYDDYSSYNDYGK